MFHRFIFIFYYCIYYFDYIKNIPFLCYVKYDGRGYDHQGFFVTFFDNDEKISSTLKANYGIRYDVSRKMEAKYAVEVVNKNGEKLETEKLVWDEANKTIYTDAFVKITTADQVIMGKGLKSNQDFTKYQINEITGTINLKNNEL
jgi:LPS export ABC transporter protein LptC